MKYILSILLFILSLYSCSKVAEDTLNNPPPDLSIQREDEVHRSDFMHDKFIPIQEEDEEEVDLD